MKMKNLTNNKKYLITRHLSWRRWVQLCALFVFFVVSAYFFGSCSSNQPEIHRPPIEEIPSGSEILEKMSVDMSNLDFSKFQHGNKTHAELPCLLCHKREDNSPIPKRSGHIPCSGCHVQQFSDPNNAICKICHTDAQKGTVKEFPEIKSFSVKFDHAAHLKETNCATCHQFSNRGVAISVPNGFEAHQSCFQCHEPQKTVNDRDISSCGICHEPGKPNRFSEMKQNLAVNFSHITHSAKQNLNCTVCHTVKAGATLGNQVSEINAAMHGVGQQGCAGCHNGSRAFGDTDFTNCQKCHQQFAGVSSFSVSFDHTKHLKTNCATCHKPANRGVALSIPDGLNTHQTCYQCHSPRTNDKNTASCLNCHQSGHDSDKSIDARAYKVSFSHAKHTKMNCVSCHSFSRGEVNAPLAKMHLAPKNTLSCASCHNDKRTFGGENFANCKRCHRGNNFGF
jgi:c(7)-type cytochrome triheme protein